ncbi:MAG TPA: DUF456 family protein [Vicinamibacterales bacterium]|jgi:hypothetical protein
MGLEFTIVSITMHVVLWILALVLVAAGVAGTVLPALPGPLLVFVGILLAGWAGHFARIGTWTLVVLGLLTALAHVIDLLITMFGVRRSGSSGRAAVGAGLGALAGLFFGIPGLIVGPFAGAVLAELTVRRDLRRAGRAGLAAWIGYLVGTIAKVAIVFMMIAVAAAALFFF